MIFSEDWQYIKRGGARLISQNGTKSDIYSGRELFYRKYNEKPSPFADKKEHIYV